jgi:hypothetical protein
MVLYAAPVVTPAQNMSSVTEGSIEIVIFYEE